MLEITNKFVLMGSVLIYTIVYIVSIFVNYLMLGSPDNNTISSISLMSDKYFTNITPAKYTFSIWGLIYSLGMVVLIYLWSLVINNNFEEFNKISVLLLLTTVIAILNPLWIMAWVNEKILLSWLVMISLLILLVFSSIVARPLLDSQSLVFKIFVDVYLGWITIAFCINSWAVLISYSVNPFAMSSMYISLAVLTTIGIIALRMLFGQHNLSFILVALWAFLGLYMQRDSRVLEYKAIGSYSLGWAIIFGISITYYVVMILKKIPTKFISSVFERGSGGEIG